MKKLLLMFLVILPAMAFSEEFNAMAVKPNILELKKFMPLSGKLELRNVHESPRVVIKIAYQTKEIDDLYKKVLESDLSKLYCDGDFSLTYDQFGVQYINIASIKACVDEDGEVVVHSVGIKKLTDAEVAVSVRLIEENRKASATNIVVNDSKLPKVDDSTSGVFSAKLGKASAK